MLTALRSSILPAGVYVHRLDLPVNHLPKFILYTKYGNLKLFINHLKLYIIHKTDTTN